MRVERNQFEQYYYNTHIMRCVYYTGTSERYNNIINTTARAFAVPNSNNNIILCSRLREKKYYTPNGSSEISCYRYTRRVC